ncbi:MAG: hypothetical protein ACK6DC_15755 [Planctomycetota bacterium]|jgi:hypothetical protein
MSTIRLFTQLIFISVFLGCTGSEEMAVDRQLRCIRIGLMNYESSYGGLPKVNGNRWRFSGSTKFSTVSWRGHVLESIEGLGYPKDGTTISKLALEASIENAGRRAFEHDGKVVCLNPLIQGISLTNLPKKLVIAFYLRKRSTSWNDDQTEDMNEVYNEIEGNKIAFLFADGTVGFSRPIPRSFLEKLFTIESAQKLVINDLVSQGFRIYEAR